MINVLYEHMGIPDACHLGKRVFKKFFHEYAKLGITDKRAFREDVDTITWAYTLKPNTIPIRVYEDEQREYHEVAVLQINAKTQLRTTRIAQIIHRAIPYPVVAVFSHKDACLISLAQKRFHQAEKGAIVADEFYATSWVDLAASSDVERAFLASLALADLPHTHFYDLYSALVDRVIALDCARRSGQFGVESSAEKRAEQRRRLAVCHELEGQIAELRAAIQKEPQFNRQVELNTQIKKLEKSLQQEASRL